jgi:hypothetical protein
VNSRFSKTRLAAATWVNCNDDPTARRRLCDSYNAYNRQSFTATLLGVEKSLESGGVKGAGLMAVIAR